MIDFLELSGKKTLVLAVVMLAWLAFCLSKLIAADNIDDLREKKEMVGVIDEFLCEQKRGINYVTLIDSLGGQKIHFRVSRTPAVDCRDLRSELFEGGQFVSYHLGSTLLSLQVDGKEVVTFEEAKGKTNSALLFAGFVPFLGLAIAWWRSSFIKKKKSGLMEG